AAHVAVLFERCDLRAQEYVVAERHVEHAGDIEAIEVTAGHAHVRIFLRPGLLREHANRAAGAVAAEQRALRTAQHFDAFDVEDAHDGAGGTWHEHVVDVVAHAAFAGSAATAADAADLEGRRRRAVTARTLDLEVRGNG